METEEEEAAALRVEKRGGDDAVCPVTEGEAELSAVRTVPGGTCLTENQAPLHHRPTTTAPQHRTSPDRQLLNLPSPGGTTTRDPQNPLQRDHPHQWWRKDGRCRLSGVGTWC